MNPLFLLASALLLQPVLEDDATLRLVATDSGGESVQWYVDGEWVGNTSAGQALEIQVSGGEHDVWAATHFEGHWKALVRPVAAESGVAYVQGWSATHEPELAQSMNWAPFGMIALGIGMLILPRFAPKRP